MDFLESAAPYVACMALGIFVGWLITIRLDDGHCQHCAACPKKTYSIHPDDELSPPEQRQREFARYLVAHGYLSEHF